MVKCAMDLVGLTGGPVRPPRVDANPEARVAIQEALQKLGTRITGQ